MTSKIYISAAVIGDITVFNVTANPDGSLSAAQGDVAIRSDTSQIWQNQDGGTVWKEMSGWEVITQRIQLGDLPAATTTGNVSFGATIPANRVAVAGLLYLNADPDPGASGITSFDATCGTLGGNLFSAVELIGESGTPKYLSGFTNDADWTKGPIASPSAGQPVYVLTSTGNDLNQMTALDITLAVLLSNLTIPVP